MAREDEKKHACPDCVYCQWCSDDRCRLCRTRHACCRRKLSLAEQIALYESLNGAAGDTESKNKD